MSPPAWCPPPPPRRLVASPCAPTAIHSTVPFPYREHRNLPRTSQPTGHFLVSPVFHGSTDHDWTACLEMKIKTSLPSPLRSPLFLYLYSPSSFLPHHSSHLFLEPFPSFRPRSTSSSCAFLPFTTMKRMLTSPSHHS